MALDDDKFVNGIESRKTSWAEVGSCARMPAVLIVEERLLSLH